MLGHSMLRLLLLVLFMARLLLYVLLRQAKVVLLQQHMLPASGDMGSLGSGSSSSSSLYSMIGAVCCSAKC